MRNRASIPAALRAFAGAVEAYGQAARVANPLAGNREAIREGSAMYEARCAPCHGAGARGASRRVRPDLALDGRRRRSASLSDDPPRHCRHTKAPQFRAGYKVDLGILEHFGRGARTDTAHKRCRRQCCHWRAAFLGELRELSFREWPWGATGAGPVARGRAPVTRGPRAQDSPCQLLHRQHL